MNNIVRRTLKIFGITIGIVLVLNGTVIVGQKLRGHPSYPNYNNYVITLSPAVDNHGPLSVDGVINFRDVGGYINKEGKKIKEGVLFRSGDLSGLTGKGAKALQSIRIKKVYDLRTSEEISAKPDRMPEYAKYVHFPIYSEDEQPGGFSRAITRFNLEEYWDDFNISVLAEKKAKRYGELFKAIANSNERPILIHCTAGKDRAGIGVALFLLMLGVPHDVVVADYTKSNYFFPQIHDYAQSRYDEHKEFTTLLNMKALDLQVFYLARADTLVQLIDHLIENYGSVENYLIKKAGLDEDTIISLRKKFLISHSANN